MDASARKSFEIQAKVRHNAETYQSTLKDLQNWEREIKERENNLQKEYALSHLNDDDEANDLKALPIRHAILEKCLKENKQNAQPKDQPVLFKKTREVTTPDEKPETAPDPETQRRKEANEMKDVGNTHVKFQQYDLAIESYTDAINLCPNEAVFYTNRAFCYLKLERYEECIEDCDRAIELDSLAVKAYYRRMQANEGLGNYMDALKDCTSALLIEPRNIECKKSLERINERLRKTQNTKSGPNFTPDKENFIEILPIDKPAYKRSNKPLHRVQISDVVGPKATETFQNLEISDDDIDKLFNSNCGPFVEVKKTAPAPDEVVKGKISSSKKTETEPVKTTICETKELETNKATVSSTTLKNEEQNSKAPASNEVIEERIASSKKTEMLEANKATASSITLKNEEENSKATGKDSISSSIEDVKMENDMEEVLSFVTRQLPSAPTTTAQFYATWKDLSDAQKYKYLSSINIGNLGKILGAGFDSETLTDCLRIIHDYYIPKNDITAAATLLEISRKEEIGILSLLMSQEDKNAITEILLFLEAKRLINPKTLKSIKTNFNLV